jgi:7-carboxy-7-deazaguanine synthase
MSDIIRVCETFSSIQGESGYAGYPCFFIRLTGCNLRCSYCDTAYAYYEGRERTVDELIGDVEKAGLGLVEITGGEPLLQRETLILADRLIEKGYDLLIETNGSQDISEVNERAVIILDMKTPGSGMAEEMDLENLRRLRSRDEVKFVITSDDDYQWALGIIRDYALEERRVLFSPVHGRLSPERLAEWMIRDRLSVRLNLQLQKYIFGERRGV